MMYSDDLYEFDPSYEYPPKPGRVIDLRRDEFGTAGQLYQKSSPTIGRDISPLAKGAKILKRGYKTCTIPDRGQNPSTDTREYRFVQQIMTPELETFLEDERWCNSDQAVCTPDDPSFEILSDYEICSQLNREWFRMRVAYRRYDLITEKARQQYLELKQHFANLGKKRSDMQKCEAVNHENKREVFSNRNVTAEREVSHTGKDSPTRGISLEPEVTPTSEVKPTRKISSTRKVRLTLEVSPTRKISSEHAVSPLCNVCRTPEVRPEREVSQTRKISPEHKVSDTRYCNQTRKVSPEREIAPKQKVNLQHNFGPEHEVIPGCKIKRRTCWEPIEMKQDTKVPKMGQIRQFFRTVRKFFRRLRSKDKVSVLN